MILVDATTLIALGRIDEIGLLAVFDRPVVIPEPVLSEVTTEPARSNALDFVDRIDGADVVGQEERPSGAIETAERRALDILGEDETSGDVAIIARVLSVTNEGEEVAVVSDDRRIRDVARGLGATVTGTIGVVVRAVSEREMTAEEGRDLVRRVDSHGLHMTAELRETAYELVDEAARE